LDPNGKVLIIALPGMGNALLFTPALDVLREQYPSARIDILVEGGASRDVFATNPNVRRVLDLGLARDGLRALNLVRRLRAERYDLSFTIFPSNRPRFQVFTRMVGARERVTHSYPDCRASCLSCLQTPEVPAVQGLHDVVQNVRLVSEEVAERMAAPGAMPRPSLYLTEEDRAAAARYLDEAGAGAPLVAMHPGSSSGALHKQTVKRWPLANFCRTALLLERELGAGVLVFCGPDERPLLRAFRRFVEREGLERVRFPQMRVREVAALIGRADVMVSNDSGLMHLATAVATPTVALFGPTNAARTAPVWGDCTVLKGGRCPRGGCFHYPFTSTRSAVACEDLACWSGLTAQDVLTAVQHRLP